MVWRLLLLNICICYTGIFKLYAQNSGVPIIRNYSYKEYQASLSNWDIIKGEDDHLYIANVEGILTFDSKNWNLIPTSSAALSLECSANNRLYYGTFSDFGYLRTNDKGELTTQSFLKKYLPKITIGPIWSIKSCNNKVYFFSKKRIFEWTGSEVKYYDANSGEFNYNLICLNKNIYFLQQNQGLITIVDGSTHLLIGTEKLANENLLTLKESGDSLSIFTNSTGQSKFFNKKLYIHKKNLGLDYNTIFDLKELNRNQQQVFSTLQYGIIITDSQYDNRFKINTSNGLLSNVIKNLFIDKSDNIWSAMQEGISSIELGSPWRKYSTDNVSGDILGIGRLNDQLYIGSTESLYQYENNINQFLPNREITSSVWSLELDSISKKIAIIGTTSQGVFKIQDQSIQKIFSCPFVYNLYHYDKKYLAFHSEGISILNENMIEKKTIKLAENTFINIESDTDHTIWASSKFKGVYKIKDIELENPEVILYNESNGLPDISEIHITEYNDKLLFTTMEGLYEYRADNPDSIKFVPYEGVLNPKGHIKQVKKDNKGNFYFTIADKLGDRLEKFELQTDNTFNRIYKPFRRLPDMEITAIYPDGDSILWVAGSEGLFKYDNRIKKDYNITFNTIIDEVVLGDSLIFDGFYNEFSGDNEVPALTITQPKETIPVFTYKKNHISFGFAAAFYEAPEKNQFSYYLENNDEQWSAWSYNTRKEYTNLSPGDYTFLVKSRNIYDTEGKVAAYSFTILPPWYKTSWAYVGFVLLGLLLMWFIVLAYSYRIRVQQRRLKLIVADRTFKVLHQKKEIEKQNSQLKNQNEEISRQRDEITTKSQKLEKFQEEILEINNKLQDLNYSLELKVEERTAKIKSTLLQLQKINKELDTFVYRASHDLKGPISRIQGLTTLAKLESTDSAKYYDLIELTALNMRGLLTKLSNTYEIMNKEIVNEEIDIPFLLSEIRNAMKFMDQDTQYQFDLQDKFTIVSDRYLIKIIFENLIENALIFHRRSEEGPQVNIKCYEKDGYFHFQITDNGIGIHPEHLGKIYEMFFKGSDQSKGNGLGLYIIKLALNKISGEISVCSKLYESSTFTVKLPLTS